MNHFKKSQKMRRIKQSNPTSEGTEKVVAKQQNLQAG